MKTKMQEYVRKRTNMNTGKKLLIVLFSLGLTLGASAQRGHFVGGGFHGPVVVSRPYVGVGFGFGYPYYSPFYPYYGLYSPFGYPYPPYYYGRGATPPRLADQIEGIKSDYKAQIKDVRHDKSLTKSDRKAKINQLEQDRDAAITQARKNFYYNSQRNYNNQNGNGNGNQQPNNGNGQQNNGQQNKTNPPSNNNNSDQPEYNPGRSTNTNLQ
jgi:hypothetical protein